MFNDITEDMWGELHNVEKRHIEHISQQLDSGKLFSDLCLKYFSDVALSLASRSLKEQQNFTIATKLKDILMQILIPPNKVSIATKEQNKQLISETLLDLDYASGSRRTMSLRLMSLK